jgi:hypothetical protein
MVVVLKCRVRLADYGDIFSNAWALIGNPSEASSSFEPRNEYKWHCGVDGARGGGFS